MENIKKSALLMCYGFKDCIFGIFSLKDLWSLRKESTSIVQSKQMRRNDDGQVITHKTLSDILLQCFLVNGLILLCAIFFFKNFFLDFLKNCLVFLFNEAEVTDTWNWLCPLLSLFFSIMWTLPQFLISRALNFTWYQEIADLTYKKIRGEKYNKFSTSYSWADAVESVMIQTLFYLQSLLVSYIPIPAVRYVFYIANLSILYSLYTFEYKWVQMGWPLQKRLAYLDGKWPYFVGFGLPLTIITSLFTSQIESICVFSVLFPIYVISGTVTFESELQKYNHPLHIFGIVTFLSNFIFCDIFKFIHHKLFK